jgi:hypothetical protein
VERLDSAGDVDDAWAFGPARSSGRNACVTLIGPNTLMANPSIAASAVRSSALGAQSRCRSARVVDQYVEMAVVVADACGGRVHAVVVGRIDLEVDTTELVRGLRSAPRIAGASEIV